MKGLLSIVPKYFDWLNNNAPQGEAEKYPETNSEFESSVPGIYISGDLTGIPLLKYSVQSGVFAIRSILQKHKKKTKGLLDVLIVGAGPSGVAAGIEAKKNGLDFLIIEANQPFHTITSYPKGKPIFAEPFELTVDSPIQIKDTTKEDLLEYLGSVLKKHKLPILNGEKVESILPSKGSEPGFEIRTESGKKFNSSYLLLAIGKSGDSRRLGVPGEEQENVFHRLIDPQDFQGQSTLVVGGGDSAIEAALSLVDVSSSVTLSYRESEISRPKEENKLKFRKSVQENKIQFLPNSTLEKFESKQVRLKQGPKTRTEKIDSSLVLIGSEAPISFLKKLGIKIGNSFNSKELLGFVSLFSFALFLYFGKASFYASYWYSWVALGSGIIFALSSLRFLFAKETFFTWRWRTFKNLYLVLAALYFSIVYLSAKYLGFYLFGKYPSFHYTVLYSTTILFFGIRRMWVRPTQYIKLQTITLILIQIFPLFLLPEIILPFLGDKGLLGPSNGFLLTQVFPDGAYWKAYGFVLAWPLNMGVLYDGGITTFWLVYGFLMSFGLIPYLVYKFGKGAYCGWICSCGGLAETLGDEYRNRMPHGKLAYKLEHSGQWILLIAAILTIAKLIGSSGQFFWPLEFGADSVKIYYDLIVDLGLGGVVGVGAYFMFSGRIWCRMFCPLSALMHIYAKFSKFRIFSEKKRCISCNICTSVCHQGIDVMNYANKGRPMDSVQCVRCSACVVNCPTQVLSFGKLEKNGQVLDRLKAVL
ncbi:NAD(P)-binding domain-containing protein [Leptospira johnsonii]|uniref:Pyridine nucleotide-disulfide oxidoreductase / 4Fe-4S binding domain multi-domain protein n=1 Tax=Leptospira johnsonii TaxID=1917820 RepID=A0A2P2D1D6_9LEPT|nr:NAD(P)-binding domain-containing protein [Leptospira johnsonii]GBF38453.1 pyridine nucleotide-disulfide oxidoreductase / 4Fe-4S binding domain multi-domain protein [Leptospira johnsonii]